MDTILAEERDVYDSEEEESLPSPALSGTLLAASPAEVALAMLRPVKLEKKLESSMVKFPEPASRTRGRGTPSTGRRCRWWRQTRGRRSR